MESWDKESFFFVERKSSLADTDDPPPVHHSLNNFPDELAKKVTLLKHFCNYLERYDSSSTDGGDRMDEAGKRGDGREGPNVQCGGYSPYVRKWLRTRHAILFRLSDGVVQVNKKIPSHSRLQCCNVTIIIDHRIIFVLGIHTCWNDRTTRQLSLHNLYIQN